MSNIEYSIKDKRIFLPSSIIVGETEDIIEGIKDAYYQITGKEILPY